MAAKKSCLDCAALKSITLNESQCKLFKEAGSKDVPAAITFSSEANVQIEKMDREHSFEVRLKMNLDGFPSDMKKGGEKLFELSSTMTAAFSIIDEAEMNDEELGDNPAPFALQIYPLMRQHLVDTLGKMGINGSASPWDIGLGKLQLIEETEIEKADL